MDTGAHGTDHAFVPPAGIAIEHAPGGRTLSAALAQGDVDGIISRRPPDCYARGDASVARLFGEPVAAETAYFARTGVFPILHIIAMRRTLVAQQPDLAREVYRAFVAARDAAFGTPDENPVAVPASDSPEFTRKIGRAHV